MTQCSCCPLRFTRFPYHNDPSIRPENFRSPEEQIVIANPRLVDSAVLGEVVIRQGLDLEFIAVLPKTYDILRILYYLICIYLYVP